MGCVNWVHKRPRVGVKGCIFPSNFKISHFTNHNIFKNTLDYPLKPFKHLIYPVVDKIIPRLPVKRRHALGCKGDANFKS